MEPISATLQINFQDHCLFCLQHQDPGTLIEIIQKNSKNIKDFQPVINYLTGTDPTYDKGPEECLKRDIPVMGKLPPLCQQCYDLVGELHSVHHQLLRAQWTLQKKTEAVRERIIQAKFYSIFGESTSCRDQFNNRILTSAMPQPQISTVLHFVNSIHDAIISEGSNPVIYPSKTPPAMKSVNIEIFEADLAETFTTVDLQTKSRELSSVPEPGCSGWGSETRLKSSSSTTISQVETNMDVKNEITDSTEDKDHDGNEVEDWLNLEESRSSSNLPMDVVKTQIKDDLEEESDEGEESSTSESDESDEDFAVSTRLRPKRMKTFQNETASTSKRSSSNNSKSKGKTQLQRQKCDLCGKWYSFEEIAEHLKTHVKDYVVKCLNPSCSYQFSCRYKMERHMRDYKGDREYFRRHRHLPKNYKEQKCPLCPFKTENFISFRSHLGLHEDTEIKEKKFPCPIPGCSEAYGTREFVEIHILYHDLRPPKSKQVCSVCKEKVNIDEMEKHLEDAHQITGAVPCKQCKLRFPPDRVALIDHIYEHRDEYGSSCDICQDGIRFARLEIHREHYFRVHNVVNPEGQQSFVCEYCSQVFDGSGALNLHKTRKHPAEKAKEPLKPRKKYSKNTSHPCDLCQGEPYRGSKMGLHSHKIQVHGADPIVCKQCGKEFTSAQQFRKHERQHAGLLKTFQCFEGSCDGKIFADKKSLQYHQRTHLPPGTEKPFKCQNCEKSFWEKGDLVKHNKVVHEKLRPHMCDTCGESFSTAKILRKHGLTHTDARPYNCPVCNQAFKDTESMKRHVKSHRTLGEAFKPSGPRGSPRKKVRRH